MHCALFYRIRRLRIHGVQQNMNYFIASGIVNDDVAAFVGRNPGPVETQVVRVGRTSHR